MSRGLIIADVSNLYYTTKREFNGRPDYEKFLRIATTGLLTYRAIAYGCEFDGEPVTPFKRALECMGYEIRFKATKVYNKKNGEKSFKADCDVTITVDAIAMLDEFDVFVLGSADGDMCPLIRFLQSKGKTCVAIGCRLSGELKNTVDRWAEITPNLLQEQV